MKEESWESLGVPMQHVPSLHRTIVTQGKINAFIHCFVAVRRIISLHDLELAICENEGVERYEELELGPLVRHPLAMHYFSVPSDAKDIFHITSEEINSYLCEFIDIHKGREISIDEFLDFAVKKKSVSGREKLSVRIQSLGMHITFIRQAKRLENDTLKKCLRDVKQNFSKGFRKRPLMSSQKRQLDEHFSLISKRIESFSSENKEFGGTGKHVRFVSSSSEENDSMESDDEVNKNIDDYDSPCNELSQNPGSSNQPSRCPYPSAEEERSRLGLKKVEGNIEPSSTTYSLDYKESQKGMKRKRKTENISGNITARHKLPKTDKDKPNILIKSKKKFFNQDEADFLLDDESMRMFIMMWKESCRVNSVTEVLILETTTLQVGWRVDEVAFATSAADVAHLGRINCIQWLIKIKVFWRMLEFYKIHTPRKKLKWFSSHPLIGLLNVAVTSIARGMWDSMYDDFQDFALHDVEDTVAENCTLYESIEVEPVEKDALGTAKSGIKHVNVDDIVQKVSTYFELDHKTLSNVELMLESKLSFLRKLCKCELWVTKQFSVEKFKSLGYGKFFLFLEKHVILLHNALQNCLTGDSFKKPSLEIHMFEEQLAVLLSQAANNSGKDKTITKDMIPPLLTRQFPLVNFVLAERSLHENFMDDVKKKGSISTCVLFSATLLGRHKEDIVNERDSSGTGASGSNICYEDKTFCSATTKNAVRVLLRAPMLSDLISWTHWDVVFAPSLGPLVRWLLTDVNEKELLCLVTKDGKVIRVDHTSSVDSFSEACLRGSSFQTAVELLSLLSLYGGETHVPLALLKCHARQAFEVILKNSQVIVNNEDNPTTLPGNSQYKHFLGRDTSKYSFNMHERNSTDHTNVKIAASFFIACLSHLSGEFRAFAADILLSGLQFNLKNAPSIILNECKQTDQRHLLHDVGLFLGIVEWIDDYHSFASCTDNDSLIPSGTSCLGIVGLDSGREPINTKAELYELPSAERKMSVSDEFNSNKKESNNKEFKRTCDSLSEENSGSQCNVYDNELEAMMVIESIRREEFGLNSGLSDMEAVMLKKQHARLGRALHCLSQELYSQDSHFLLELIQNADDNIYAENVEPTLTFILQEFGIVVLNNEIGFSSQNIRALCDVGSSTKKGVTGGYIGKKGIGFKSVFRVTDAPEIHSNGFHVKFDITEGQIGFVLPTVVPACDVDYYKKLVSCDTDRTESSCWNTCIVLPFRTKLSQDSSMNSIRLMFCDLHPSLLLFLHRLQCIRFRSISDDTMVIMRKELLGNGIVNVSFGKEKMTWFVASQVLQANSIRRDVQTTEISIAFTLQESGNGEYVPRLEQQPVFAYLPLRKYGLKFIIQGDFVLPSSREEVDGDSPWNQWLLAKFPDLFVNAEKSFCASPCYGNTPGKAVSFFMSFVPLIGEVQGFFSSLPRLIISKLRMSKCLLMEGDADEWVLPCKVLRNWNDEALNLFPASCLHDHLGLGFLDRNIDLSDSLARDLGIQEYGPYVLVQVMTFLCHSEKGIKSAGLVWLSSCLNALYTMLFNSSGQISSSSGTASDVINSLRKVPFIPLSGGAYSSVDDGTIWLHSNSSVSGLGNEHHPDDFPALHAKLWTVSPALFSAAATVDISGSGMSIVDNVTRILLRIGVQQLSDHEIVKVHILPAISDHRITFGDKNMMLEYLAFVMCHLQFSCPNCHAERGHIISELRERAFISTNYGYKRPTEVAIHFSGEFGNPINVNKLINGMDLKWHEVDAEYLQHPITGSLPSGMRQWREFFQQIGITDFVQVVSVEKRITELSNADLKNILRDGERILNDAVAKDWESQELVHLLSQVSLSKDRIKSQYLLEALDTLWEEYYSNKVAGCCIYNSAGDSGEFKSSLINCLSGIQWVASSTDDKLHYSKELFYDCETVHSVLGVNASYAVPKLKSEKLLSDIGFKMQVSLDDVLSVLRAWRTSETPFRASIAQMSKLYTFVWNEMATSRQQIVDELQVGPFIFCPYSWGSRHDDDVLGVLLSPSEVHWHDFTGSIRQIKETLHHRDCSAIDLPLCKTLSNIYPSLQAFFVHECGVSETPHHRIYLQILLELSAIALPSQTAKTVFEVFLQWSDGLKSGLLNSDDVIYMKECLQKIEFTVLPTLVDKWVSLHPSFGLVCWCDDNKLKKEFKVLDNIEFLYFGELSDEEQDLLRSKVSVIMQTLGIPSLSEVITRDAIYYGMTDCSFKTSLLNWAFPYAQRYIYNAHRDRYLELKQSGFELFSKLRVIVVDKLFSRNIVKGSSNIASSKRRECKCLLQGNLLYATQESDSHSLFMEFSRLLVGAPDLHLANFLHMITTMAESGSNEDQTEYFIFNSQKIPKLPDGEPVWYLPSPTLKENDETLQTNPGSQILIDQTPMNSKRKHGLGSSWPPADWKTAPGFSNSHFSGMKVQSARDANDDRTAKTVHKVSCEIGTGCNAIVTEECDPTLVSAVVVVPNSQALDDHNKALDTVDIDIETDGPKSRTFFPSARVDLSHSTPNPQALVTGRMGEHVAYNYFSAIAEKKNVTWVNQDIESGLPYDLVIEDEQNSQEYIEVKATKSSNKDWFHITLREWLFALEKGENFTIAHVILSDNVMAKITMFKNPIKLCQLGKLHLAVLMPKQPEEFSTFS